MHLNQGIRLLGAHTYRGHFLSIIPTACPYFPQKEAARAGKDGLFCSSRDLVKLSGAHHPFSAGIAIGIASSLSENWDY